MSEYEAASKTPSEVLADIVVEALSKDGLLLEDDASRMAVAISSGKAKAEDWRLAIEKIIDREKGNV